MGEPASLMIIGGDLLDTEAEALVNAWNRNIIPWWALIPCGVSKAIKKRAGTAPFRELARHGPIPLGGAAITGAGRLPHRAIVHVAAINMAWRASEGSVEEATRSALEEVRRQGLVSVAMPVLGSGAGGLGAERALAAMLRAIEAHGHGLQVTVVRYRH